MFTLDFALLALSGVFERQTATRGETLTLLTYPGATECV